MPELDADELSLLIDTSKRLLLEGFQENDSSKLFAATVGFNSLSFYLTYLDQ